MTIEAKPISEPLGPKQEEALLGPVDMVYFVCSGCNRKYLDTGLYFFNKQSVKCLWCTKFPKIKK
jgi:hypothetical protein